MLHNKRHRPQSLKSRFTVRKRKRVTLIAAFKCDQGVVVCADTKETVTLPGRGQYRVRVTKIKPQAAGEYDVVIGGAGDAHLVDGFTRRLVAAISSWPAALGDAEIESNVSDLLLDYHSNQVAATPRADALDFIMCLKSKRDPHISLWELRDVEIAPIDTYSLIGWEEPIYDYEVKWLYRDGLRLAQAALLGIRLFTMAKNTSDYVGGDTQLIVITDHGMDALDQEQVDMLKERVQTFNDALAQLVLDLPDTSIEQGKFSDSLKKFQKLVMHVREYYLGHLVGRSLYRAIFDPNWKGDISKQFPPHTVIERTQEQGKSVLTFSTKIEELDEPDESIE